MQNVTDLHTNIFTLKLYPINLWHFQMELIMSWGEPLFFLQTHRLSHTFILITWWVDHQVTFTCMNMIAKLRMIYYHTNCPSVESVHTFVCSLPRVAYMDRDIQLYRCMCVPASNHMKWGKWKWETILVLPLIIVYQLPDVLSKLLLVDKYGCSCSKKNCSFSQKKRQSSWPTSDAQGWHTSKTNF